VGAVATVSFRFGFQKRENRFTFSLKRLSLKRFPETEMDKSFLTGSGLRTENLR
jgi:hypothetical protein